MSIGSPNVFKLNEGRKIISLMVIKEKLYQFHLVKFFFCAPFLEMKLDYICMPERVWILVLCIWLYFDSSLILFLCFNEQNLTLTDMCNLSELYKENLVIILHYTEHDFIKWPCNVWTLPANIWGWIWKPWTEMDTEVLPFIRVYLKFISICITYV